MDKLNVGDLVAVSDGQLTEGVYRLCSEERAIVVEQLIHLAEIERRNLHLELGYGSTFDFCRRFLGHIKSKAFRRSTAARLLARFPVLADHLRDGRLCVTTLVQLRDVLVEHRLDEVLARAAGKTEDEIKELVAALEPKPAPLDLFRRLPAPAPVTEFGSCPEPLAVPERPPAKLEPISEELRVLRITVGRDFADDLARARAAFGGDIPAVIHHCLRVALEHYERRRRGTGRAAGGQSRARGRYIVAAVRDAVWRRDEARCAYLGPNGIRCTATERLEVHHVVPFARGGQPTLENLALRCRLCRARHNPHYADSGIMPRRLAPPVGGDLVLRGIIRGSPGRRAASPSA